jgi:hypothetical protein
MLPVGDLYRAATEPAILGSPNALSGLSPSSNLAQCPTRLRALRRRLPARRSLPPAWAREAPPRVRCAAVHSRARPRSVKPSRHRVARGCGVRVEGALRGRGGDAFGARRHISIARRRRAGRARDPGR